MIRLKYPQNFQVFLAYKGFYDSRVRNIFIAVYFKSDNDDALNIRFYHTGYRANISSQITS